MSDPFLFFFFNEKFQSYDLLVEEIIFLKNFSLEIRDKIQIWRYPNVRGTKEPQSETSFLEKKLIDFYEDKSVLFDSFNR